MLLLQDIEDIGALWFWLVFILLPVIGRVIGWISQKLSPKQEDGAPDKQEAREARREKMRELERRGEDMWKRILGGEEEPQAGEGEGRGAQPTERTRTPTSEARRPAPAPRLEPVPEPRPATVRRGPSRIERIEPIEPGRPAAAATLPHERLPSTTAEPTLRRKLVGSRPSEGMPGLEELEPVLAEVGSEYAPVRGLQALGTRVPRVEGSGAIEWADLRQAVLWSEILGPPVSMREPRPPWSSTGLF